MFCRERLCLVRATGGNCRNYGVGYLGRWLKEGDWCDACRAKYAEANHARNAKVAGELTRQPYARAPLERRFYTNTEVSIGIARNLVTEAVTAECRGITLVAEVLADQ